MDVAFPMGLKYRISSCEPNPKRETEGGCGMKKTVILVVVALSVGLFPVPDSMGKTMPPNYFTLKAGGFFPQSSDLDDIDADAGFLGELTIGHNITPGFAVEAGVGYFETEGGFSSSGGSVEETFKVVPLTLSLRGQVPYGRFQPYGIVGLGVYFVEDEISGNIPALGLSGSDSDEDASLGFHVGFGGNYTLPNNLFLGVEVRYLFVETGTFGVDFRLDGVTLTGNVGYRF